MVSPGVAKLASGATQKNVDFSTLTLAYSLDHNFVYRYPKELILLVLDSTFKEL